ncbi:MAG: hypothetical protein IKS95_05785 [Verrucomicrobia bacterium]|nr:hypothetical protein [Verrucomicrobiota bacterium]
MTIDIIKTNFVDQNAQNFAKILEDNFAAMDKNKDEKLSVNEIKETFKEDFYEDKKIIIEFFRKKSPEGFLRGFSHCLKNKTFIRTAFLIYSCPVTLFSLVKTSVFC